MGRFVTGLSNTNFRVFEDGVEQRITAFSDASPISLAVVVNEDPQDALRLEPDLMRLRDGLGSQDELLLVYARGSQPQVASSLAEFLMAARRVAEGGARDRSFGLDAVYTAADRLRTAKNARRALLAVSSSTTEDLSIHSESDVLAMARTADVIMLGGGASDLPRLGIEVHNQYILVYDSANAAQGTLHQVEVRLDHVEHLPPLSVRAHSGSVVTQ
jgi:hypothetical protein